MDKWEKINYQQFTLGTRLEYFIYEKWFHLFNLFNANTRNRNSL